MADYLPPPPGQTPVTALPEYGGAGGDIISARFYAGQDFLKSFGRNPSQTELDLLAPSYLGGNGRVADLAGGSQAVAKYHLDLVSVVGTPDQAPKVTALSDATLEVQKKQLDLQNAQLDAAIEQAKAPVIPVNNPSTQSIFGILAKGGSAAPGAARPQQSNAWLFILAGLALVYYLFGKRLHWR